MELSPVKLFSQYLATSIVTHSRVTNNISPPPPVTQVDSVKYGSAATTRKNNREHPAEVCAKKQMHSSCLSRLSPENTSAPLALSHCISTDRSAHMVLIDTGHPPP